VSQVKARKSEGIEDESLDRLMNALAELYVVDGRYDKALSVYLDQVRWCAFERLVVYRSNALPCCGFVVDILAECVVIVTWLPASHS
jgi:hypothetical protein